MESQKDTWQCKALEISPNWCSNLQSQQDHPTYRWIGTLYLSSFKSYCASTDCHLESIGTHRICPSNALLKSALLRLWKCMPLRTHNYKWCCNSENTNQSPLHVDVRVYIIFKRAELTFGSDSQFLIIDGDQILGLESGGMCIWVAKNFKKDTIFCLAILHVVPSLWPACLLLLFEGGQKARYGGAQSLSRFKWKWDGEGRLTNVESNRCPGCNHFYKNKTRIQIKICVTSHRRSTRNFQLKAHSLHLWRCLRVFVHFRVSTFDTRYCVR